MCLIVSEQQQAAPVFFIPQRCFWWLQAGRSTCCLQHGSWWLSLLSRLFYTTEEARLASQCTSELETHKGNIQTTTDLTLHILAQVFSLWIIKLKSCFPQSQRSLVAHWNWFSSSRYWGWQTQKYSGEACMYMSCVSPILFCIVYTVCTTIIIAWHIYISNFQYFQMLIDPSWILWACASITDIRSEAALVF